VVTETRTQAELDGYNLHGTTTNADGSTTDTFRKAFTSNQHRYEAIMRTIYRDGKVAKTDTHYFEDGIDLAVKAPPDKSSPPPRSM
jgi:hypothetical protein